MKAILDCSHGLGPLLAGDRLPGMWQLQFPEVLMEEEKRQQTSPGISGAAQASGVCPCPCCLSVSHIPTPSAPHLCWPSPLYSLYLEPLPLAPDLSPIGRSNYFIPCLSIQDILLRSSPLPASTVLNLSACLLSLPKIYFLFHFNFHLSIYLS